MEENSKDRKTTKKMQVDNGKGNERNEPALSVKDFDSSDKEVEQEAEKGEPDTGTMTIIDHDSAHQEDAKKSIGVTNALYSTLNLHTIPLRC